MRGQCLRIVVRFATRDMAASRAMAAACAMVAATAMVAPLARAGDLRDPMRPPAPLQHAAVVHEPAPVLSAVMGAGANRVAIFNGQLVRSGGSVGAYAIQAVFEDGVRYRHDGLIQELHLPRSAAFKKPSTAAARPPAGVQ